MPVRMVTNKETSKARVSSPCMQTAIARQASSRELSMKSREPKILKMIFLLIIAYSCQP